MWLFLTRSMRCRWPVWTFVVCLRLAILSGDAKAQSPDLVDPPAATLSLDDARRRMDAITTNQQLPEAERQSIVEVYQQVINELEVAATLEATRQTWVKKREQLPAIQQETAARLDAPLEPFDQSEVNDGRGVESFTAEQLNERVSQVQKRLTEASRLLEEKNKEPKRRSEIQLEAPQKIVALIDAGEKIEAQSPTLDDSAASPEIQEARQAAHDVRLRNNQLRIDILKQQLGYYDDADNLLELEIELAKRTFEHIQQEQEVWKDAVNNRRAEIGEEEVEEKEQQLDNATPEVRQVADRNLELAESLKALSADITKAGDELAQTKGQLAIWREQFDRLNELTKDRIGVSQSVGNLLREQRAQLPDIELLQLRSNRRRNASYEIRSLQFATNEELLQLENMDQVVSSELSRIAFEVETETGASPKPADLERYRNELNGLFEERRGTLKKLQAEYVMHAKELTKLGLEQEELLRLSRTFASYIDQQVLWIRSIPIVDPSDFTATLDAFRSLLSLQTWRPLAMAVAQGVKQAPLGNFFIGLLAVAGFVVRQRSVHQIKQLGEQAQAKQCRSVSVTIKAFAWTLICSAPIPLLLVWISRIVSRIPNREEVELSMPVANAALSAACVFGTLSVWGNVVRPGGLAEAHFQWLEVVVRKIRNQLNWFVPVIVPLVAVFELFADATHPTWERSVARFSLIAIAISTALFMHGLLSPKGGLTQYYLWQNREGWLYRLRLIWYPPLIAIPLALGWLSLYGYQYTAERLMGRLLLSAAFLSALVLVEYIAWRAVLMNRRTLAIAQARERLANAAAGQPEKSQGGEFSTGVTIDEQVNLTVVNEQTRRLLTSFVFASAAIGVYLIWIDVLPALERLNEFRLWETTRVQSIVATGDATHSATQPGVATEWITLGSLLGSLVVLVLTWVAVRNIPGLLEIAILQHLPIDTAARFAMTTVTRYVLIMVGVGTALGNVGFGWSKIQWLAAAVSVGLGFGLQEIFANFISGLILLFERPLRAGDIVTVGDVTGTVVEIKTRATTIQDWDRKELVVPNKEFITERLLNWTLTDQINRVVIQVGVAYGSDVKECRRQVLSAAQDHADVLDDPSPSVTFDLFGDNALNMTLRCYLASMDNRLSIVHELHESIYLRLNEAGIEIPFPQRDVHMV